MTTAVDDDLAASILAMWQVVRQHLQEQRPEVGRIEAQAKTTFNRCLPHWLKLVEGASAHLAGFAAEEYADQLANLLSDSAAKGLAVGMDVLLDRGWNPEVAWQRVLAGYGLDARRLRGLLGGAMPTPNASGAGAAPDSLARTAVRTTLAYAETLARTEIKAWDGARDAVAKAYDPQERRDSDGKWTRGPAGKPTKVREQELDPLAGIQIAEEASQVDPFTAARANPFAAAGAGPFAAAARRDPFAAARGDPFAAAKTRTDPFAAAGPSQKQADFSAAGEDLFAEAKPKQQNYVYFMRKQPGDVEPEDLKEDPRERHLDKHYVPVASLGGYFTGKGGEFANAGDAYGEPIDFSEIGLHLAQGRNAQGVQIGTHRAPDPWGVDVESRPYVDPRGWEDISGVMHSLWSTALAHTAQVLQQMTPAEIHTFGEWAGFSDKASLDTIKKEITENTANYEHHPEKYDGSAIEAMCDYAVWHKPQVFVELGRQMMRDVDDLPMSQEGKRQQVVAQAGDIIDNVREWRDMRPGYKALLDAQIPSFISFAGGFTPRDINRKHDLTGRYQTAWVRYRSALGELGSQAPPGIIGLREVKVRPDPRV